MGADMQPDDALIGNLEAISSCFLSGNSIWPFAALASVYEANFIASLGLLIIPTRYKKLSVLTGHTVRT